MTRLIGLGLAALAFALLLTVGPAQAQVAECEPQSQFNAQAIGSPLAWHVSADGGAFGWWCLGMVGGVPTAQAFIYGGRWADGWDVARIAAPRIAAAASPWEQFKTEAAAIGMVQPKMAAGSPEECTRRLVLHGGCVALHTSANAAPFPAAVSRTQALEPGRCGPVPVCTAQAWVVDAPTAADGTRPAFKLTSGVRAETSTGRAATGQPCRPEVAQAPSQLAGKVFAAYGPNYAPGMVALCRKG